MPKRVWELSKAHLSAPETTLSRGLLPQAHINLRSVFGKRENADNDSNIERFRITHRITRYRRDIETFQSAVWKSIHQLWYVQ